MYIYHRINQCRSIAVWKMGKMLQICLENHFICFFVVLLFGIMRNIIDFNFSSQTRSLKISSQQQIIFQPRNKKCDILKQQKTMQTSQSLASSFPLTPKNNNPQTHKSFAFSTLQSPNNKSTHSLKLYSSIDEDRGKENIKDAVKEEVKGDSQEAKRDGLDEDSEFVRILQARYTEYMRKQNEIACGDVAVYAQIKSQLRDNTNQLIKSQLNQLTQLYSKHRLLKSSSNYRIQTLQLQLQNQQSQTKQLTEAIQSLQLQQSQQSTLMMAQMKEEFGHTCLAYEKRIALFLTDIQHTEEKVAELDAKLKIVEGQLRDANRVLRIQQEKFNEKCREVKGLEALVAEYETVLRGLEDQKTEQKKKAAELETKIEQLQKQNKSLSTQLKKSQQTLTTQTLETSSLQSALCTQKSSSSCLTSSLTQKISALLSQICNIKQSLSCSLKTAEQQKKKREQCQKQLEKNREIVKIQMQKIVGKFVKREKLCKRVFGGVLRDLRGELHKFKGEVLREMFKFYFGVRTQISAL